MPPPAPVISADFPSSNPAIAFLPERFPPATWHSFELSGYVDAAQKRVAPAEIMVMP